MKWETLSLKTIIKKLDLLRKAVIKSMKREKIFISAWKLINRKNAWSGDAKEHYQSFMRKKNTKSVKLSKIII